MDFSSSTDPGQLRADIQRWLAEPSTGIGYAMVKRWISHPTQVGPDCMVRFVMEDGCIRTDWDPHEPRGPDAEACLDRMRTLRRRFYLHASGTYMFHAGKAWAARQAATEARDVGLG